MIAGGTVILPVKSTRTLGGQMTFKRVFLRPRLLPIVGAALLVLANCGGPQDGSVSRTEVDVERLDFAVQEVKSLRSKGKRVWCVPFARNASGIEIYGNAKTWWSQAKGQFSRGKQPQTGAVMAFQATRSNPLGHVAVVSKVEDSAGSRSTTRIGTATRSRWEWQSLMCRRPMTGPPCGWKATRALSGGFTPSSASFRRILTPDEARADCCQLF